jgi:hypothetical protein
MESLIRILAGALIDTHQCLGGAMRQSMAAVACDPCWRIFSCVGFHGLLSGEDFFKEKAWRKGE